MADAPIPHFSNDAGVEQIEIGVKKFMCVGASAPFDHPHVFIDMGSENEKVCPYCSTLYKYNPQLTAYETKPEGNLYKEETAA
ncbi:MAG: zinc-finger domain-containing protein [Hyphomicrobiales bacterium]